MVLLRQGQLSGEKAAAEECCLAGWHDPWIIRKLKSWLDILIIPESHMQGKGNEEAVVSLGLGKAEASFLSLQPHASPQCFLLSQSQQTKHSLFFSFFFSLTLIEKRLSESGRKMYKLGMISSSISFQRIDCATFATPYRIMDSQPREWEACYMSHNF